MRVVVGALAAAVAGLMWAPWVATGRATRSSFQTFRTLQTVDLEQLTIVRVIWFLLPVVLAGVVLAAAAKRVTCAALGLLVVGIIHTVVALIVILADLAAWGARLALVGGLVAVAISSLILVQRWFLKTGGATPDGHRLRR